jgi:SNF2 family DNA or RNA helicase
MDSDTEMPDVSTNSLDFGQTANTLEGNDHDKAPTSDGNVQRINDAAIQSLNAAEDLPPGHSGQMDEAIKHGESDQTNEAVAPLSNDGTKQNEFDKTNKAVAPHSNEATRHSSTNQMEETTTLPSTESSEQFNPEQAIPLQSYSGPEALDGGSFLRKKHEAEKRARQTVAEKQRQLARTLQFRKLLPEAMERVKKKIEVKNEDTGPVGPDSVQTATSATDNSPPAAVPTSGDSQAPEIADFATLRESYEAKRREGRSTIIDEINFMKAAAAEEMRVKSLADERQGEIDDDEEEFTQAKSNNLFLHDDENSEYEISGTNSDIEGLDLEEQDRKWQKLLREKGVDKRGRVKANFSKEKSVTVPKISKKDMQDSINAGRPITKQSRKRKIKQQPDGEGDNPATKKVKKPNKTSTSKKKESETKTGDNTKPRKPRASKKLECAAKGQIESLESLIQSSVQPSVNSRKAKPVMQEFTSDKKKDVIAQLIAQVTDESMQAIVRADANALSEATKNLDYPLRVKVKKNGWQLNGMTSALRNFQLLGLGQMRNIERNAQVSRGGILADEMGLGKTVTMLANLVDGKPPPGDPVQATLIVVPTSLVSQWMSEVEKHLDPTCLDEVVMYDGEYKKHCRNVVRSLQRQNIVITTYGELSRSYPKNRPPGDLEEEEEQAWWEEEWEKKRGPLHRIMWLRVVLDECQAAKNHYSHTFKAAKGLMARYRWLMTGTPVVNEISELYAFSQFLKTPLMDGSFGDFQKDYLSEKKGRDRLHQYLKAIMIRRTHNTEIMGSPIVELPEKKQKTVSTRLSSFEDQVYKIVQARLELTLSGRMKRNNNPDSDLIWKGLIMLAMLRQLTGHPLSCISTLARYLDPVDMRRLWKAFHDYPPIGSAETIAKVKKAFKELGTKIKEHQAKLAEANEDEPESATEQPSEGQCVKCGVNSEDRWITACEHVICNKCLDYLEIAALTDIQNQSCPASNCGEFVKTEELRILESCPSEAQSETEELQPNGEEKVKRKEKYKDFDIDVVLVSAKMRQVKRLIQSCLQKNPGVKIVVFTQFMQNARMVGTICEAEKWGHCMYTGKMSRKARTEAISDFQEQDSSQILIASFLAGGVGLNLTMAARAILIDPYWNVAMENQGECLYCRSRIQS